MVQIFPFNCQTILHYVEIHIFSGVWFMPVIPDTWEGEIERIMVRGQSRQKVSETHFNQ
jgi:hypothetical protein